jgi:hypothetical protein
MAKAELQISLKRRHFSRERTYGPHTSLTVDVQIVVISQYQNATINFNLSAQNPNKKNPCLNPTSFCPKKSRSGKKVKDAYSESWTLIPTKTKNPDTNLLSNVSAIKVVGDHQILNNPNHVLGQQFFFHLNTCFRH